MKRLIYVLPILLSTPALADNWSDMAAYAANNVSASQASDLLSLNRGLLGPTQLADLTGGPESFTPAQLQTLVDNGFSASQIQQSISGALNPQNIVDLSNAGYNTPQILHMSSTYNPSLVAQAL